MSSRSTQHIDYLHGNNLKLSYSEEDKEHPEKITEWKKNMKKKFGHNGEFYKCTFDNLYFYIPKSNITPHIKCPSCNFFLCYNCKTREEIELNIGNCCIRGRIRKFLKEDAYEYIKPKEYFEGPPKTQPNSLIHLVPFVNVYLLMVCFSNAFFWKMDRKDEFYCYENRMKKNGNWVYFFIRGINLAILAMLMILFAVEFHLVFLVFYIVSFISGKTLIKKYLGIVNSGLKE